MENQLPTIMIVLAGTTAGLLLALGFLLYRFRRLRRRHQAEIDTLMGIAGNPRIQTIAAGNAGDVAIDHDLSGIRSAIERLSTRLDQYCHEHNLSASEFRAMFEQGAGNRRHTRSELDRVFRVVNDTRHQSRDGSANPLSTAGPASLNGSRQVSDSGPAHSHARNGATAPAAGSRPAETDAASVGQFLYTPHHGINVEEITLSEFNRSNPNHSSIRFQAGSSTFDNDVIFFQSSLEEGREQGWYFHGVGDVPHGPFSDRETAARTLAEMHGQVDHDSKADASGESAQEDNPAPVEIAQKKSPG